MLYMTRNTTIKVGIMVHTCNPSTQLLSCLNSLGSGTKEGFLDLLLGRGCLLERLLTTWTDTILCGITRASRQVQTLGYSFRNHFLCAYNIRITWDDSQTHTHTPTSLYIIRIPRQAVSTSKFKSVTVLIQA